MKHVISLELDELDTTFIEKLRELYSTYTTYLTIELETEDETDFLLKSEVNRERLIKSIKNIEEGNVVTPNLDEFREKVHA